MVNWTEENLFNWLKHNIYPDLVMAKNPTSKWDCYSPSTSHRIELKCRRKHYDKMILERKKYVAMLLECEKHFDIPIYINSTPKGVYLWNLLEINPTWETNFRNPATTQFGNTNRIKKEVAYLEILKAKFYER
jgi:hypothetical protein